MLKEAWRSAVHGVTKNQTWLSDWTMTTTNASVISIQIMFSIHNYVSGKKIFIEKNPTEIKNLSMQTSRTTTRKKRPRLLYIWILTYNPVTENYK